MDTPEFLFPVLKRPNIGSCTIVYLPERIVVRFFAQYYRDPTSGHVLWIRLPKMDTCIYEFIIYIRLNYNNVQTKSCWNFLNTHETFLWHLFHYYRYMRLLSMRNLKYINYQNKLCQIFEIRGVESGVLDLLFRTHSKSVSLLNKCIAYFSFR